METIDREKVPASNPGIDKRAGAERGQFVRMFCGIAVVVGIGFCALGGMPDAATFPYLATGIAVLIFLTLFGPWLSRQRFVFSWRVPPEAALLIISIFFAVTLGEVLLRLFFSHDFPDIVAGHLLEYKHDPVLGWRPVPNHEIYFNGRISNNSAGFRGAEFRTNSTNRILFLGDSFVWGYGIETSQRFTEQLQDKYPEWDIYNVGVCSYGTDQEYLLLQAVFDKLSPKIVFLIFCTENDQADNSSNFRQGSFKPYYLTNAARLKLKGVPVPRTENLFCVDHSFLSRFYLIRLVHRVFLQIASAERTNPDPTLPLLAAIQKFVEKKGARLAVGLTARKPQIEQFLEASGIPWVDLSTDLKLPNDMHWSGAGHSFVAEKLDRFFATQGYFPTRSKKEGPDYPDRSVP